MQKTPTSGQSGDIEMTSELAFVDDFLLKWDRFAQGDNTLVPFLKENTGIFIGKLTRLVKAGDKRAPARLVFYPIVQVGGFIAVDSELGRACTELLGKDFPITTKEDGKRVYFSADLYFWWQKHKHTYEEFSLFEDWKERDFAKSTVIPMYEALRK